MNSMIEEQPQPQLSVETILKYVVQKNNEGKKGDMLDLGTFANEYEAAAVYNIAASILQDEPVEYNQEDGYILTL